MQVNNRIKTTISFSFYSVISFFHLTFFVLFLHSHLILYVFHVILIITYFFRNATKIRNSGVFGMPDVASEMSRRFILL